MKRKIGFAVMAIAALALTCQSADARGKKHHRVDHRVKVAGLVVGAGATAGFFALNQWRWSGSGSSSYSGLGWGGAYAVTSIGCAAVAPMVATAVVKRPLTMREGHTLVAGCFVPFVGPWIVKAIYDSRPDLDH